MKRFLIVLMVCVIVSIAMPVLAEVEFGNWDKWDEELPPADHEDWYWAISTNKPREWILKGWGIDNSNILLIFSDLFFYGDKKGKTKVSVLFYSLGDADKDKKEWDIPDASLALAAFPPEKGKMVIRAYRKVKDNNSLEFSEEWQILFKNYQVVVLEDAKFRKEFEEWFQSQISCGEWLLPKHIKDMIEFILPELIKEGRSFTIINVQPKTK